VIREKKNCSAMEKCKILYVPYISISTFNFKMWMKVMERNSVMSSTAITGPSATDSPTTIIERRCRDFDTDRVFKQPTRNKDRKVNY
jgi:hypothetical protein